MSEQLPLVSGTQNKALSQWFTPRETAERIALMASQALDKGKTSWRILEPSAGRGALVTAMLDQMWNPGDRITAIDLDISNVDALAKIPRTHAIGANFLEIVPGDFDSFDLAIMNPPFEGGQTEAHIMHALKFADRVVCHCPLTTLAGKARRQSMWSNVQLHRLAICSARPKYGADGGKTDMCTIDVTLNRGLETQVFAEDVRVEWWP
jgi:predicted RNA methylase